MEVKITLTEEEVQDAIKMWLRPRFGDTDLEIDLSGNPIYNDFGDMIGTKHETTVKVKYPEEFDSLYIEEDQYYTSVDYRLTDGKHTYAKVTIAFDGYGEYTRYTSVVAPQYEVFFIEYFLRENLYYLRTISEEWFKNSLPYKNTILGHLDNLARQYSAELAGIRDTMFIETQAKLKSRLESIESIRKLYGV